jgi:acyl transferase domain-containing protein/3-hydroxymyristoyl/3-hydroxydecanoyl-(acyl carrier protein) dehydratase/1-acyl-sn-glycerol-3-phosphate acyltransferase
MWTDRGGYVQGFEQRFDASGFAIAEEELAGLDPLFKWVLHSAREALRDAGHESSHARVGAIFGNLSFPSASMSRYAESVWMAAQNDAAADSVLGPRPDARNRFTSGLPALILERGLSLEAGAFALDAACASSLYAIKNACDWLHDGRADIVLAGAVNCADDLFIHVGFSALSALSRSGRSRPFNREADGLVPAEGAAFVALRRLEDARREGDEILAVVRGVGLSNDGRGQGTLVPSREGQVRAIRAAYEMSGVSPSDISLLECHATGTVIGDATEIESLSETFGTLPEPLGIGSLKSNMGHLVTAAGVAGLIKVLEGMRAGVRAPTLHAEEPISALDDSSFRVLDQAEPWHVPDHIEDGVRRAGISAFGFGGNNAHLIVEQFDPEQSIPAFGAGGPNRGGDAATVREAVRVGNHVEPVPVAIVGVGVVAAGCSDRAAFSEALLSGASRVKEGVSGQLEGRIDAFEVDISALGIPPNDLRQTLPQQLLAIDAGRQAAAEVASLPRERTGVFVGMGTDPEVARYGARWRLAQWAPALGGDGDTSGGGEGQRQADWLGEARDGVIGVLESAGVLGTMPNIIANRLNRQLDLGGASCTVSAEERSGLQALAIALRALREQELDAALVGAVDLSCEPVHIEAAKECLPADRQIPGDVAVAVLLKRLEDAVRDGDRIYAIIADEADAAGALSPASAPDGALEWGPGSEIGCLTDRFGHAHAASGLFHLVAAALSIHHRRLPSGQPWLSKAARSARVAVAAMDGRNVDAVSWQLSEHTESALRPERAAPRLHVFEGRDVSEVMNALDEGRTSTPWDEATKPAACARLVVVAGDEETLRRRSERARAHIQGGAPPGEGVHFRSRPVSGDLAFVFTSAGSAYHGMGQDLLGALPELGDRLAHRFDGLVDAMGWVFDEPGRAPTNDQRLWGASCLCQMHAELTRGLLGLQPDAAIGYSSGESNSLFALGAWTDMDAMRREIDASGLYTTELAGRFDAVARAWGEEGAAREKGADPAEIRWAVWGLLAPVAQVRELIAHEERVHLAIIHTANDCVIAGDANACRRIVDAVRADFGAGRCHELEYNMAAHVPEVDWFRDAWLSIHRREVSPVPGVRFYSGGCEGAYIPDSEACTKTIMSQAHQTLDFSRVVERAWADGVRVFVEHGPMSACSGWIRDVLGERASEAVIVPLDRKGSGIETIFEAIAALIAAGVRVDPSRFLERLSPASQESAHDEVSSRQRQRSATRLRLPAHLDPVRLPSLRRPGGPYQVVRPSTSPRHQGDKRSTHATEEDGVQIMRPAPTLPSTLDQDWVAPMPPEARAAPATLAAAPVDEAAAPRQPFVASPAPLPSASVAEPAPMIEAPPVICDPAVSTFRQQVQRASQVHQHFVSQQAQIHQRFLAMRQNIQHVMAALGPQPVPAMAEAAVAVQPAKSAPSMASESDPDPTLTRQHPFGPCFDRAQLEIHASGRISEIYGPMFEQQDGHLRQVRMPEPPLLLADRVTGIDAKPGVHGTGILWTETDVCEDSWYLHKGRMPAGIMIESGQADLMLISYMGADFLNQGTRVYRLLGCELTYEGDLPEPGETLCYEIHVDGHARQDDVRLFFFHYECLVDGKPRIRVKGGQAGFFTDEELANSEGILWSPEEFEPVANPRLDPPAVRCTHSSFDADQVRAFAEGRPWECFGEGFDHSRTHTETPAIQSGKMLFLDAVSEFDPSGGPWGRGYLRAEAAVHEDDWFFDGHFKNDPCMPGTLMFEGCLQAMSFYLAALGFTLERDAWRFQPVSGEPIELRCRGQVTPASNELVYELFIEEVIDGPEPTLYADLLCTVDGRKAFHARRAGLKLVPDWPLSSRPQLLANIVEPEPVASVATADAGRFEFGRSSILACAWGRPSDAFGPMYTRFDAPGRVPRLPGPPYLFISRVTKTSGEIGGMQVGSTVETQYDIPADAWYFAENGTRTMPYCVLLEAALQPCGWLASYIGSALSVEDEVCFRNLDGTATVLAELFEDAGTLRTAVTLTNISKSAGMIIVSFEVECFLSARATTSESGTQAGMRDEQRVYVMDTVFGFFPPEALSLENQIGQPTTDEQHALLDQASDFEVDLRDEPARYFGRSLGLGHARLRTLDRVTGYWPEGGAEGLGRVRAERSIDVDDWYFKAHFFQDPVQPGSLGIEAMIQTLQFFMLESGMGEGIDAPRFESIAVDRAMTWKYRGQVVPLNETVQVTLDVTEIGHDESGPYAIASASLWCDGIRIYSADRIGMRIVAGAVPAIVEQVVQADSERTLDPAVDVWLADHRPTWNRPALPMMYIADLLASAISGPVVALRDVQLKSWVDFDGPRRLWTEVEAGSAGLFRVRLFANAGDCEDRSDGFEVASGQVETGSRAPAPTMLVAVRGTAIPDPYAKGNLFHGPAFQLMKRGEITDCGASTVLDAGAGSVPIGSLHPALLDAALHGIPHDRLHDWAPEIGADKVAYPARILELTLHGRIPIDGEVRCEVRFDGYLVKPDLPRFRIQLIGEDGVFAQLLLIEACFPKGALGSATALERRAFLRDREFVEGVSLSRRVQGETRLCESEVEASDWMPGTIEGIYRSRDVEMIAVKEHLAARERLHPSVLPEALPLYRTALEVSRDAQDVVVRDEPGFDVDKRSLDLEPLRRFWNSRLGVSSEWLGQDLWEGLIQRYVGRFVIEDPDAFAALRGRGAIFVGNHQVQIESLLVTNILSALTGTSVVTMANAKHEQSWIGWILRAFSAYPGYRDPESVLYFDQSMPGSMFELLGNLEPDLASGRCAFFVHPQGTRSQSCREPVTKISSLFLDLALEQELPIVPVRIAGGLPVQPVFGKLEFPIAHCPQDYTIGAPISFEELRDLAYAERGRHVLSALNSLGRPHYREEPNAADPVFSALVKDWQKETGTSEIEATFFQILQEVEHPGPQTLSLVDGARQGVLRVGEDPKSVWLAELARRLYGPAGPRVEIGTRGA